MVAIFVISPFYLQSLQDMNTDNEDGCELDENVFNDPINSV